VLIPASWLGSDADPVSLKPFGLLVSVGVYLGGWLSLRYASKRGVSARALSSFMIWVMVGGFVVGHVLDVVFYSPERVLSDPLSLLRLWDGLSSYGGFTGALLGALWWGRRYRAAILPYADVVASAFPAGWAFGRAGCAVVHDHPGVASDAWFAVAYPGGGRLDLGLLELVLTIPLAIAFLLLRRRAWPWGFFLGTFCVLYAPVRFGLDFLRLREPVSLPGLELAAERRYWELTPAQWASIALAAAGVVLLRRGLRAAASGRGFALPPSPVAFASGPSDVDA
jgi:phosphatidylglycerol:prolipoprotein diacylglycerol transferase